ncbi:copper amine oxidase N-terminal domain-containing protein [Peptoniphilus genitalis]
MKRIIKISILSLALLVSPVFANNLFNVSIGKTQFQVKEAGVLVNGKLLNTEFSPYIKQGRTFVPIREITENLGADVKWNNKDKSIKISLNGDVINMKINSPNVSVNGKKVSLDNAQAPQLALYSSPRKETKTMVPLRFISETFGYDVDWNNDEVRAEISTDKSKSIVDGDDKENSKDTKKNKNSKSNKKTKSKNKSIDSKSIFDSDYFQSNQEKRETNKIKKEINDGNKDKVFDQADLEKSDEKAKRVIKNRIEVNGKLKIVIDPGHIYYNRLKKEKEVTSKLISSQEIENEKIDLSSDRFQERNKKFIEKISEIQKLEDDNLVITSYNFDKGRILVKGLVKDEAYFNKKFKDINIVSKNFYKENGFNKFEMQIK